MGIESKTSDIEGMEESRNPTQTKVEGEVGRTKGSGKADGELPAAVQHGASRLTSSRPAPRSTGVYLYLGLHLAGRCSPLRLAR